MPETNEHEQIKAAIALGENCIEIIKSKTCGGDETDEKVEELSIPNQD